METPVFDIGVWHATCCRTCGPDALISASTHTYVEQWIEFLGIISCFDESCLKLAAALIFTVRKYTYVKTWADQADQSVTHGTAVAARLVFTYKHTSINPALMWLHLQKPLFGVKPASPEKAELNCLLCQIFTRWKPPPPPLWLPPAGRLWVPGCKLAVCCLIIQ